MSSRVEQLQLLLQKKRDAEQKALQIVVALLETGISREFLVGAARYINLEYYSDVTTERAISFTCGYPLCDKRLTNVPHQKYRISLRQKKVYDLTELKNFCSDQCFRASKYFEAQLSTSPVWLLDEEQSERVVRPSLIDDDPISSSVDTATTPSASGRRGCTIADRGGDSAAVVVSVGDIAARVDDLSLLDNDAAESPAARSHSSLARSPNIRPTKPGDVTTSGQLRSPPPAMTDHEMSPASSKQSANALGRVCGSPAADLRQTPPSRLVTAAQPRPSAAQMPPSQVAFNRLMEWCTEATTAWLLNIGSGSQCSSSAAAAAAVEPSLSVESSPANDGGCSSGTSSAADRGSSTAGPEASVATARLSSDHYAQRALHFLVAGERRVATAVGGKEAAALSNDAPADAGRTVPPSEAHSQEAIRRRIVTERLTKSLGQAEALIGDSVITNLRSRNISRLVASFKLTKDNATMKPSEWLLIVLMLAYMITLSDEVTNQKMCTALTSYGYTARDLELIRQRFCGDAR